MMKRIRLILLTLVLAGSVAGCGFGKQKREAKETEQVKTVATQAANPYDERVRILQEEIARLKQRMEIVEDKLNGTRGPRRD